MFKILIIDDDPTLRMILKRTIVNQGYEAIVASNGEQGIKLAQEQRPALIICDWMMTPVDGLEVCRTVKAYRELSSTFFVLLTAKGEVEDRVMGLDAGADEFLSKPLDMNELKARVRAGLRLYLLNEDLRTQKRELEELNKKLRTELDEAAEYVRSLLPIPLKEPITTEALFKPSAELGGDCFDFYKLDDEHLAIYLLDVSGHGVGSALLSVSVLNVMRSQSLPNTNFAQPSDVLKSLNQVFEMTTDKYFTIWYGVYNHLTRQLVYATAGHPPAILFSPGTSDTKVEVKQLGIPALPIGILPDEDFEEQSCQITSNSTLYIFSDGAYEINLPNGQLWGLDALINVLQDLQANHLNLNNLLEQIRIATSDGAFDDDLSMLKVSFI
ncbi:MAG: SpoIIE family protein phosphatase [Crinalium sp.]